MGTYERQGAMNTVQVSILSAMEEQGKGIEFMPSTEGSPTTQWNDYSSVAVVIDDFLERLRNDPLVWPVWAAQHAAFLDRRVRALMVDFIASASGGPTIDVGDDMELAPAGRGFTSYEYAAFTRNLDATLEKFVVPESERNLIRTLIARVKSEIVKE